MSMRDFITRVLNTPHIVTKTPPPIVVEIPPPIAARIVTERSFDPSPCKSGVSFYWDAETRSAAKLGKGKEGIGARAYAEHPTTERSRDGADGGRRPALFLGRS